MFEDIFVLVFCSVLALGCLATVAWQVLGFITSGSITIDGIWLTLICLTLAAVFGGNIAWSIYTGELKKILHESDKGSSPSAPANEAVAGQK